MSVAPAMPSTARQKISWPGLEANAAANYPPLYYALMLAPYLALQHRPLAEQVFWLRLLSLAVASLTIPLGYAVARQINLAHGRDDFLASAALPGEAASSPDARLRENDKRVVYRSLAKRDVVLFDD